MRANIEAASRARHRLAPRRVQARLREVVGAGHRRLRPRGIVIPPEASLPSVIQPATSMRVLFYGDVVARSRENYRRVWSELRMDNLQTELADQVYTLAKINQSKYEALTRLYAGVAVMTAMLGGIIATIGAYRLWP